MRADWGTGTAMGLGRRPGCEGLSRVGSGRAMSERAGGKDLARTVQCKYMRCVLKCCLIFSSSSVDSPLPLYEHSLTSFFFVF